MHILLNQRHSWDKGKCLRCGNSKSLGKGKPESYCSVPEVSGVEMSAWEMDRLIPGLWNKLTEFYQKEKTCMACLDENDELLSFLEWKEGGND